MTYYRLYENLPSRTPFGFGVARARWNHTGVPIIYLSNHSSIAINEMLSIKGPVVAKSTWILASFHISGPLPEIPFPELPKDWNARPAADSTRNYGTDWAAKNEDVCIKVPSARLNLSAFPNEHNLLVNPMHNDFRKSLNLLGIETFHFQLNI